MWRAAGDSVSAGVRGIPGDQLPVRALRFAAPVPVLEGVRPAVAFGTRRTAVRADPGDLSDGTGWLTLDVSTPDPGGGGLPVLVWIICGGYMAGTPAIRCTTPPC
ncbi:carboxylesterase family protein [Streptomyces californicus]